MTNYPISVLVTFSEDIPNHGIEHSPQLSFTLRERQIIGGLSNDLTVKLIADNLQISAFTVQEHIKNIKVKMAVHTPGGIVAQAFRIGLVQ